MESYIGRTIGGFNIERLIGKGGQGFVFRARQESLKRDVALKVIPVPVTVSSNQIKRFMREARATSRLKHPNIVEVYQIAQEAAHYFYAMELIEGWALDKIIEGMKDYALTEKHDLPGSRARKAEMKGAKSSDEPETAGIDDFYLEDLDIILRSQPTARDDAPQPADPPENEDAAQTASSRENPRLEARHYDRLPHDYYRWTAKIIQQAATALEHAHQNGIIHRDIKPSNLMVSREDVVKITDFGLAREAGEETITVTGAPLGTPAYMSPEQIRSRLTPMDARTDIYSLGVTLYEAISLDRPFKGRTTQELYHHISVKEPNDPRNVNPHAPRDLAVIALKAVEKDPAKRYQSALEMADDLERYLSDIPILAKPPTLVGKTIKFLKRNNVQVSIASAAAALLMVIFAILWGAQVSKRNVKINKFLQQARQADMDMRYEDALSCYNRILVLDPDHVVAVRESSRLKADLPRLQKEREEENRRQQALKLAREGETLVRRYFELQDSLARQERKIKELSKRFRGDEPVDQKAPLWNAQKELKQIQHAITETFGNATSNFTEALGLDPDNREAKSGLADLYWHRFTEAEAKQDEGTMTYFGKLIDAYDVEKRYADKLKGDGTIEVASDPPGAKVYLYEYVEQGGILTPSNERELGVTPTSKQPLAMGSYLIILKAEGYRDVRYPILIERQENEKADITLYTDEEIGKDFIYVPAGEFIMGGGEKAFGSVERHKEYVDSFFISKFEVTCAEYLEYINDIAERDPRQAGRRLPRPDDIGVWKKGKDNKYVCPWNLKWPVYDISWYEANAYVKWKSERDGREYRLPMDAEWEKAARGVDARTYPWGNQWDWSFCCTGRWQEFDKPSPVGTYEKDESPYGVRDMAGNLNELCGDPTFDGNEGWRLMRGGAWCADDRACRTMSRQHFGPGSVAGTIGFRIASTPPPSAR